MAETAAGVFALFALTPVTLGLGAIAAGGDPTTYTSIAPTMASLGLIVALMVIVAGLLKQ